jgi:hypothetical protein
LILHVFVWVLNDNDEEVELLKVGRRIRKRRYKEERTLFFSRKGLVVILLAVRILYCYEESTGGMIAED